MGRFSAGTFDFKEIWEASESDGGVEKLAGFFAAGDAGEHRAEECGVAEFHHGRAHFVADLVHGGLVEGPQLIVNGVGVGHVGVGGVKSGVGESFTNEFIVRTVALFTTLLTVVNLGAQDGVQFVEFSGSRVATAANTRAGPQLASIFFM